VVLQKGNAMLQSAQEITGGSVGQQNNIRLATHWVRAAVRPPSRGGQVNMNAEMRARTGADLTVSCDDACGRDESPRFG
jgi:hypothetical protein